MLPFIGSIKSNCCATLTRQATLQEDLDGGILTVIGVRMSSRRNREESRDNDHVPSLIDDGTARIGSSTIGSTTDILYSRRVLARSAESLYPFDVKRSQLSPSIRRYSHNLNDDERRRSLTWARLTAEERIARTNRRISDNAKSLHPTQSDPLRGLLTLINL
ncbi:unnamed protein product [Litomosoides sigmodontis]|uniref:Uncharacterized protein n=1 Tax=Litomosoides sigmodontis TaxID=42156 RepID=A0A3P6SRL2_LITSI|nr:unnamed protein product [Litomosoides sigmodontis]